MNDLDLVREFRAEVPEPDTEQMLASRRELFATINSTGMIRKPSRLGRPRWRIAVPIAAAIALAVAAPIIQTVGSDSTDASNSSTDAPGSRTFSKMSDFVRYMRQYKYDYSPVNTPAALARQADVVLVGTIVDVQPGQSYAPTPTSEPRIVTSVLHVQVKRVVAGDAKLVSDGLAYIEVAHPARMATDIPDDPNNPEGDPSYRETPFDQAAYAETVPRAYGIFFLDDRTATPYWPTIREVGAGRPLGSRLTASYAQGFLIEDESGALVSVLEPLEDMPPAWQGLRNVAEVEARASER